MDTGRKEYFRVLRNAFAKHYREQSDEWTRDAAMRVLPALVQGYLKLPAGTRVLDIGCGCGADVEYLARIFSHAAGVDLYAHDDWSAIEGRRPNAAFHATAFLRFTADTPFDLVLDNGCLHHQHPDEYDLYLKHLAGLLSREGYLVLSTFKSDRQGEFIDGNGRLHRYFSDAELHGLLSASGFGVVHEHDIYRITKGDYYRITYARRGSREDLKDSRRARRHAEA